MVLIMCDNVPLPYDTHVGEVTFAQLSSLNVPVTGSPQISYGTRVVNEIVSAAVSVKDSVMIVFDSMIHESQSIDVEFMVRLAYSELSTGKIPKYSTRHAKVVVFL